MVAFIALFTGFCGFRKRTRPLKTIQTVNKSSPRDTIEREQTNDTLHIKKSDCLQNKETTDQDTNVAHNDNSDANLELPLPPARKSALRGTYSCNNMVLRKSMSTKKKMSASLTIQMPRSLSMALKRDDVEEDKSVRMKKLKAENSILVRPIILGEKCRVLDDQEEGDDEDHSQRMPKNKIYHPRSLSSISISRTNSKIDVNVIPVKETSEDLIKNEGE